MIKLPHLMLLETMLWEPNCGWFLLDLHLDRLQRAASRFDFVLNRSTVIEQLTCAIENRSAPTRGRVLLSSEGDVRVQVTNAGPTGQPLVLAVASSPIDSTDLYLQYKTTNRATYNRFRAERPDADDVILWNERNELTEACLGNLCLKFGIHWFTPDLRSGLLAGTYRQHLINTGQIKPKVLPLQAIYDAESIVFLNSVRKWCPATLID